MKKLSTQKRAAILRCLIEGNSVRATVRITGAAKDTVLALLARAGEACLAFMDEKMRDLPCDELQMDEIWSFVGCREGVKDKASGKHPGDVWTWTALCPKTKVIPAWRVGDRSHRTAFAFCADLSKRIANQALQITTDGHPAYQWAIGANFKRANYARLVKIYGKDETTGRDRVLGVKPEAVFGTPDMNRVSTSYAERSNLTIRMGNRRFTRLTNAFSKKLENHRHQLAITFMHYNFVRRHMSLKKTPAQAAGVANHEWTMENVVEMMDAYFEAKLVAEFNRAFDEKYTPQRTSPKTYAPVVKQAELPWYLDMSRETPPDGLNL